MDQLDWDYDLSYRVGGGYDFGNGHGEITCTFWHYDNQVEGEFHSDYGNNGNSYRIMPQSYYPGMQNINVVHAEAQSSLEMNVIDIEYKKTYPRL